MKMLFTIGCSNRKFDEFLMLLRFFWIVLLLDVRSTFYNKGFYRKDYLPHNLYSEGIEYMDMGDDFGDWSDDPGLYAEGGYLDFEKAAQSERFLKGKRYVKQALAQEKRIVLMGTNRDPINCHRAIMVGRDLSLEGIEVNHILTHAKIQTQKELEKRLEDRYFPDGDQLTLFNYKNPTFVSREERLSLSYRKRNEEIWCQQHLGRFPRREDKILL